MTGLFLLWFAAADPDSKPMISQKVSRAGVDGTATADATVPLSGQVRLTLTAEGESPLIVKAAPLGELPGWHIRRVEKSKTEELSNGRQRWQLSLRYTPIQAGKTPLRPPKLQVIAGGREIPVEIEFQPLMIDVTTTIDRASLDEARGVTGPEAALPVQPIWRDERLWAVLIGVAAIVAAVWAGRRGEALPPPEQSPADWASTQLDRLNLDSSQNADELANVLRGFLSQQFQVAADGRTTVEITALLTKRNLPAELVASWKSLLESCDVVRFANTRRPVEEWRQYVGQARQTISASLRVGEAADSAATVPTTESA